MKRTILSAAVLALAIGGMGVSSAAPAVYKVTGGGQTLIGTTGAGNTIAFSAQSQGEEGSAAKGQFQYVDRSAGNGRDQVVQHGEITCVVVYAPAGSTDGGVAVLGGVLKDGTTPFRVDVMDDGQGGDTLDMVRVSFGAAAQDGADDDQDDVALCDTEEEGADTGLGRGNVKIHKEKGGDTEAGSSEPAAKGKKPATLNLG